MMFYIILKASISKILRQFVKLQKRGATAFNKTGFIHLFSNENIVIFCFGEKQSFYHYKKERILSEWIRKLIKECLQEF